MPRNFRLPSLFSGGLRGPTLWLAVCAAVLLLANIVVGLLLLFPPGGTRAQLIEERDRLRVSLAAASATNRRLKLVSSRVQSGSQQSLDFESLYILPERTAYAQMIAEVQRMAKSAGLNEGQWAFSREPIEGSDTLTLLSMGVRLDGSYDNLMRFLHEVDRSTMLLMIDALQASPIQKSGTVDVEIRFQSIMREDTPEQAQLLGGQP